MKRFVFFCSILFLVLSVFSCVNKGSEGRDASNAADLSSVESAGSEAVDINGLLSEYDSVVSAYVLERGNPDSQAFADSGNALADIGEKLSVSAFYFDDSQLALYNEITAKLGD